MVYFLKYASRRLRSVPLSCHPFYPFFFNQKWVLYVHLNVKTEQCININQAMHMWIFNLIGAFKKVA